MARESERTVGAVGEALRLLEAFDRDGPLRLRDLHQRTGLNRSRILRFAGTLEAAGYLERDASGDYWLGLKLFALGSMLGGRISGITDLVRPSLQRLANASGNTAFYSILHGFDRLVLAKEESREGLRFYVEEGGRRPLHSGATGKLLLAYAPAALRRQVLEQPTLSHPVSVEAVNAEALEQELEGIRDVAFAISRGEATPHGFAVAVPVFRDGGLPAALTIAGPLAKLTDTLAQDYVTRLRMEAAGMGKLLSGRSGGYAAGSRAH